MIFEKLKLIFTTEELERVTIKEAHDRNATIIVDVHGMKCYEAKRFINNIINAIMTTFRLLIIHGYRHGTAIKNMIESNLFNSHISGIYDDPSNQGRTLILVTQ